VGAAALASGGGEALGGIGGMAAAASGGGGSGGYLSIYLARSSSSLSGRSDGPPATIPAALQPRSSCRQRRPPSESLAFGGATSADRSVDRLPCNLWRSNGGPSTAPMPTQRRRPSVPPTASRGILGTSTTHCGDGHVRTSSAASGTGGGGATPRSCPAAGSSSVPPPSLGTRGGRRLSTSPAPPAARVGGAAALAACAAQPAPAAGTSGSGGGGGGSIAVDEVADAVLAVALQEGFLQLRESRCTRAAAEGEEDEEDEEDADEDEDEQAEPAAEPPVALELNQEESHEEDSGWGLAVRRALEALPGTPDRRRAFHIHSGPQGPVYEAVRSALGGPEERLLWHGTSWQSLPNILRSGFNRAYSGRHGTKFGVGTYFSPDAEYALRFCDKATPRALLLARVLVGRWTKGAPGLREPPLIGNGEEGWERGRRYDSTVDNCERPRIFCVFRDFQALPVGLVVLN